MSGIRKTLDIFAQELPDPEVTLFEQITRQFTLFSKLPVELRLSVWKDAFSPARHVDLAGPCLETYAKDPSRDNIPDSWLRYLRGGNHQSRNNLKAYFPFTLAVNQESRAETQKHYAVTFPKDVLHDLCGHDNCEPLPLWVNPDIDSIFISQSVKGESLGEMVEYISQTAPKVLQRIRALKIYNNYDSSFGSVAILGEFDLLLNFPSLRTVYFEASRWSDPFPANEIAKFKLDFRAWFQSLEKRQKKMGISQIYFEGRFGPRVSLFLRDD
jgi:hypothetical protein